MAMNGIFVSNGPRIESHLSSNEAVVTKYPTGQRYKFCDVAFDTAGAPN